MESCSPLATLARELLYAGVCYNKQKEFTMLLSLILLSQPAHALQAAPCEGVFQLDTPPGLETTALPLDSVIPVLVKSICGMSGPIEISLHRVVNGELAEAVLTMEPDIQVDTTLVLFEPDSDLLEFTDYAFAMWGEVDGILDSPIYTTGDTYAVGMMDEAPILEITSMVYRTLSEGVFSIDTDVNVTPAIDDDALSYIELFNSEQPDVPLTAMLPGIDDMVRGTTIELAEHTDGSCYFVVQTDTLGNESAPSEDMCAVPLSMDSTSGGCACSSGSGSASWLASLFAVGIAMVRRRR